MVLFPKSRKIVKITRTLVFGLSNYSPSAQKIINKYKDEPIISLKLIRKELSNGLQIALQALTVGEFKSKAKQLGYDKLYQLSMIIDTDKGRFLIEKGPSISLKERPRVDGEIMDINVNKMITVETLLNKAEKYMGAKYFTYEAEQNNCGKFILSILEANGLSNPTIFKFVNENLDGLFKPKPKTVINTITETGGRLLDVVDNELND